jgi:hypothetical protein
MDFGYVPLVSVAEGMRQLRDRTHTTQIVG